MSFGQTSKTDHAGKNFTYAIQYGWYDPDDFLLESPQSYGVECRKKVRYMRVENSGISLKIPALFYQ